jgi:hypothetical protein
MVVSFYTILKQRLKIFWSSTPTDFSYEPPLPVGKERSRRLTTLWASSACYRDSSFTNMAGGWYDMDQRWPTGGPRPDLLPPPRQVSDFFS